jgi:acid phosphatase type 7
LRRAVRGTAAFLILLLPLVASLQAPASAAVTTIPANADSFVLSTSPNSNRGGASSLKIRNDAKITYIRFVVPALAGGESVGSATLRVYATTASRCALGVEVLRAANDTWGETTIKWTNQPGPTGPVLASTTWTAKGSYRDFDVTAAVPGAGPVSFLLRHAVGCNVTSDVGINSREAAANQPQLVVETVSTPPTPACSDGVDNDADGLIDHPADPGCTAPSDTDETDPPPPPACSDGIDNDGDGLIDHPADPGCTDASDTDETDPPPPPTPACSDGIDNDVDGLIDHPADPGCTDPSDTDESDPPPAPACSDGVDNDVDGLIDHPADPGCAVDFDTDETDVAPGPLIATAGDIVCDPLSSSFGGSQPAVCQHRATASLLAGADAVLPLGDLQYPDGSLDKFVAGYDPSWGQHASTTYPTVGNHEYSVPGAQGYFDYWASKERPTGGVGAGYYFVDIGSWRLIALNSNCTPVPCKEGTAQNDFLELALAPPAPPCILAYWHHPLFNSGTVHGASMPSGVRAFWDDLYAGGADVVLNGHEHNYQRYAKQDPAGQAVSNGIREFVVGTGGKSLYTFLDLKDANYELGNATDFGVLKLRLGEGSYSWEWIGVNGAVLDVGGPVACN